MPASTSAGTASPALQGEPARRSAKTNKAIREMRIMPLKKLEPLNRNSE